MLNNFRFHIAFLIILYSIPSFSQKDTNKDKQLNIIIKADILFPTIHLFDNDNNAYSFTLEKEINSRTSFQLTYISVYSNLITQETSSTWVQTYYQYRIIPEYKYYFRKFKKHEGIYAGVYSELIIQHNILNITSPYIGESYFSKYKDLAIGGGIVGGFQSYFRKRIVIDIILGIGIRKYFDVKNIYSTNNQIPYVNTSYLSDGRLAVNIGYRF